MAVKKATVDSVMAKVAVAADKAEAPKAAAKKAEAPKAEAKKAEAPKAAAKKEAAPKTAAKKPAAKKAAAKKPAAPVANVVIEFAGGQVATADIVAKAVEVSNKKSIKELNVYYQPETGMVYFTADGEEGSFAF